MGSGFHVRPIRDWLLTYSSLPDLCKDIAEALYTAVNSLCVNIEPIDSLASLFSVEIKVGVKHVKIERRPSRWKSQVLRELTFPFL
jgi:hypothetical protein